ncbi:MAG: ABC transporter permease [Christensenellales bacterium]|jgi:spermidine/putrescine transport system permease protein
MVKLGRFIQRFYLGLVLFFLYAPIVVMIIFSFNESKVMGQWTGFTLDWYAQLFSDSQVMRALYITVLVAVLSTVIATVTGSAAAIGMHTMRSRPKLFYTNVTYLPLINPDIVTGVSLMVLFLFAGMQLNMFTMLLAHCTFNIPYVIFSVLPKLTQMDPNQYEAALDLGASPWTAIRRVVLPQIKSGIVTGAILSFTLSLDDFVISRFTSVEDQNLSMLIYSRTRLGVSPTINALSALMFGSVLLLLFIANWRSMRDRPQKIS